MVLTMFSRLKSHHNPSCSIHQTTSDIQVLRQHDLKKNAQVSFKTFLHWNWEQYSWHRLKVCRYRKMNTNSTHRRTQSLTWTPTLSWSTLLTGLWASIVFTKAGSLSRASKTRTDPGEQRDSLNKQIILLWRSVFYPKYAGGQAERHVTHPKM